jgi:hypothetical protein
MVGKKFERQEQENLERYVNKRLSDARAKANPAYRDQQFLYAQGQPQPQPQPQQVRPQEYTQPPAEQHPPPKPVSTVPPGLRKPSVMPQINDDWLWEQGY